MKYQGTVSLVLLLITLAAPLSANDNVDKVIYLVFEGNSIIATNANLGRFDELKLSAQEKVIDYSVANAVAVVVTNQRYLGYGAFPSSWQGVRVIAGEKVRRLEADGATALVVTSDRILTFSGRNGSWSQTKSPLSK